MITALGWAGAALLVVAYALVSLDRITGSGSAFQALNVAGGAALMINSGWNGAWPSAVLNVVWVAVGLAALVRQKWPDTGTSAAS